MKSGSHSSPPKRKNGKRSWRVPFIEGLRQTGNVAFAARQAGITRRRAYMVFHESDVFRKQWEDAVKDSDDRLEQEALRRAVAGIENPVWMKDENGKPTRVDVVKSYSDVLLMFLMKARNPQKYRDNYRIETVGPGGGPVQIEAKNFNVNVAFDWDGFAKLCGSVRIGHNGDGAEQSLHQANADTEAGPVPVTRLP